ncbi:MAG: CHAT domain-containing protein, partial [bacterium]
MSKKPWYFVFACFMGLFPSAEAGSQPDHTSSGNGSIRSRLSRQEVLLEYTVSDSVMVINAISRFEEKRIRQRLNDDFMETVRNYRRQLKLADISELAMAAWKMYTLLLSPVKRVLNGKSRLIIIPGNELLGIAFESFLTEEPEQGTCGFPCHRYLIRDFEVTYHYSVGQWAESMPVCGDSKDGRGEDHGIDFAGFSPVFTMSSSIVSLPASQAEVSDIVTLFGRKGLSARMAPGEESGKKRFLEMASTSRVIHIATHHDPGNGRPGSGGFLFWLGE